METRDLTGRLLVAGSGKTGRDIGLSFLARGWAVTWLTREPGRREDLSRRLAREIRRLEAAAPAEGRAAAAQVRLLDDPLDAAPDLFLEAVGEEIGEKHEVFRKLVPRLPARTLLLSNSSSLLPGEIHPRCLGAHCFYPLAMTRLVEAIVPGDGETPAVAAFLRTLRGCGLDPIVQTPANAFAVNRLLLPLQAEAVRALRAGWPAPLVDRASATPLLPFGHLAFMDAVGLDVIAPAVANYLRRMDPGEAGAAAGLRDALLELLALGKRGKKNRDGFLLGSPLPWGATAAAAEEAELAADFRALAWNSCSRALACGDFDPADLRRALAALFGGATTPEEEDRRCRSERLADRLERRYRETGLAYFRPAGRLLEAPVRP